MEFWIIIIEAIPKTTHVRTAIFARGVCLTQFIGQPANTLFQIIIIIFIIIIIIIYAFRVFTSALADGVLLEFEW